MVSLAIGQENIVITRWQIERDDYARDPGLALQFFLDQKQLHPENPWVAASLAMAYGDTGQYEKSSQIYESLLALAPDFAAPWYHLAINTKDDLEREKLLRKMVEKVPDHVLGWEELSHIYQRQGKIDLTCQCLAKVAETFSHSSQLDDALERMVKLNCFNKGQKAKTADVSGPGPATREGGEEE